MKVKHSKSPQTPASGFAKTWERNSAVSGLDLTRLSTEDLWKVHETVTEALAARIIAEREALDSKLALLERPALMKAIKGEEKARPKRKYPKVLQKYQNPHDHNQTWSGRGKQPSWVADLLRSGTTLDDLVIPEEQRITEDAG